MKYGTMEKWMSAAGLAVVLAIVGGLVVYPTVTGNPVTYEQHELQEYKRHTDALERIATALERMAARE